MDTVEDEQVSALEAWMGECHTSFWKVWRVAKRYLHDKEDSTANAETKSAASSDVTDSRSFKSLNEIELALELPKAELTEFRGDSTEFYAFMSNFETNVETKLSNNVHTNSIWCKCVAAKQEVA